MGAKQSGPAENGRTRAYSGSDLPSSNGGGGGGRTAAVAMRFPAHGASGATSSSSSSSAAVASHYTGSRTRSVGGVSGGPGARPQSSINIPSAGAYGSQDSGNSTPEENGGERERSTGAPRLLIGSLPAHLSPHLFGGFKCPVCSKFISSDEMDLHLVMCLTRPRVTYNGECVFPPARPVETGRRARLSSWRVKTWPNQVCRFAAMLSCSDVCFSSRSVQRSASSSHLNESAGICSG
ncbi:E3 ubiquitin-protein ligase znrf2-like [Puntigrus tetrazona]|uniref:E3 ubiquitin-protein ligase znrf2-like n=1 Tax=Puntigrus tetrazona TaxID=1606681 RepID=UPI001C8AFD56|nr:E3 ubiquitin-protein ligase znrf2-like [Puntigrus tetrazona]